MPKRSVFDADDNQLARMEKLGLNPKQLGWYSATAFEEWLKRREARHARAEIQKKKRDMGLD